MAAVHLQPDDVASWLSTMSSAVPAQVLTNLKQDVTTRRLHGLRFSEILNECRTDDLRVEHLSPLHMARLRKAWNADFPETVDLRRPTPSPGGPVLGQLQDPVPQGREPAAVAQRQMAWEEPPRQRFDSPRQQPPSPQQHQHSQGGFGSQTEAPHAVLTALVVIVVNRLSCWAGLDMHMALSELRDVLPPPVWDELSTVFLKHRPTAQVVELLCHKARNMLAGEVALWQDTGASARQQQVERHGGYRSPEVLHPPQSFEPPRRRFEVPVDTAPQAVANNRYVEEVWQDAVPEASRRNATNEIGRRPAQPPDSFADSIPIKAGNRRGEGTSFASTNGRPSHAPESLADNIPIAASNRRMTNEGREPPNAFNDDTPLPKGVSSRPSVGARQPVPKAGAGHGGGRESSSSSSRGPTMVAAWVRTLPPTHVPDKEREALACAIEAEGIDGEKFTKVAQAPQMLATRGVPSPQHALKVRKAWEQVLREDACRQIALESASASKVTQKAVKMVF